MSFSVAFYCGGSESGSWRLALPVATEEAAVALAADVVRAGRPALVAESRFWEVLGLPEGAPRAWDFVALRWRGAPPPVGRA